MLRSGKERSGWTFYLFRLTENSEKTKSPKRKWENSCVIVIVIMIMSVLFVMEEDMKEKEEMEDVQQKMAVIMQMIMGKTVVPF